MALTSSLEGRIKNKLLKIVDEEKKKFGIEMDYIWFKSYQGNPSYKIKIRMSRNGKPISNKKFLSMIALRVYEEMPYVHRVIYNLKKKKN